MSKEIKFNEKDYAIVKVLKEAGKAMTNKEISAALETAVAAGTLTSCVNKGIIAVAGKVEVSSPAPRQVNTYAFVTDEKLKTAKGKEKTYSETEMEVIATLKAADAPMSIVAISEKLDKKISAGAISGIVKVGNIAPVGKTTVIGEKISTVNTYKFVKDIDEAAEQPAFKAE
jgi:hypothetical protein